MILYIYTHVHTIVILSYNLEWPFSHPITTNRTQLLGRCSTPYGLAEGWRPGGESRWSEQPFVPGCHFDVAGDGFWHVGRCLKISTHGQTLLQPKHVHLHKVWFFLSADKNMCQLLLRQTPGLFVCTTRSGYIARSKVRLWQS